MSNIGIEKISSFYNSQAPFRKKWRSKNNYYHTLIENFYKFHIAPSKKILELGCGTGNLLSSLKPSKGVGIDIAGEMIKIAKKDYPNLTFIESDAHSLPIQEKFDYIILSDTIGDVEDLQKVFEELHKAINPHSRIIITYFNYLWEPLIDIAQKIGIKMPQPQQNWLSSYDLENLFYLTDLEIVKKGNFILLPLHFPYVSNFINKIVAKLPIINNLCLVQYFIVRQKNTITAFQDQSVSVIIPARNEEGNIDMLIKQIPILGTSTEIIFVEGGSIDNTYTEIKKIISRYGKKDIKLIRQRGIGKGDAVRTGFKKAKGEILMILDADMTVPPKDLSKFYKAIITKKGELIMGSRLIYPMENQAMKLLNTLGNKFFSIFFSFLLDQKVRDTLCGTKVLLKKDYEKIDRNRHFFGNFDPFGDFDLIFGASKQNLKILEIPVRYKARIYGNTNISRFKHGLLLLKMTIFAVKKVKFI
ncbi:MAG: hypothetical protein ACD_31C00005G0020 [uncultured bacterium]|uniref:Glycosyl transferase n=3 Tax=Candidatus Daviesiibacteriota TaxID=1752718 RepID=A0A0G0FAQ3_9BACT|nr:MAG: hypothetical protein ACD_31C00005G0020 [uncultured bacterium]KKQ10595.1 MAG: hypothetical protein US19_C0002G0014 [Candidatus Daviesbacteria bacterium GW2011_GWB1_36_5]KKQ15725.1 MAG: hypothetical protein US28_C0011G0021 [Candidatus Daviesbacteria bacterium GW2011_GWA1_36_8]OGE17857.1 MAG: glycosyl transferase [Candidatus Daviesbacteria bacterium RIFCSPHIGHO2_01_FULL_36_37]